MNDLVSSFFRPAISFARSPRNVIQSLLQTFSLDSLPFLIVVLVEKDRVFARDDRRSLRQRNHLGLHHALDRAGDLDDKFLSLAARFDLRVTSGLFQNTLGAVAVDPLSDFF